MAGLNSGTWYYHTDLRAERASRPAGDISIVMPDYFRTLRIPTLIGQDFGDQDRFGGTHVGILNQSAARAFLALTIRSENASEFTGMTQA